MFRTIALLCCLALPTTASAFTKAEAKELYALAEAHRVGETAAYDPVRAFEILSELSDAGNLRATARLGTYYAQGIGTDASQELAENAYLTAIQGGRESARVSYAKYLARAGRFADADDQYALAAEAEVRSADMRRVLAHATGAMGDATNADIAARWAEFLSDPEALVSAIRYHDAAKTYGIMAEDHLDDVLALHRDPESRFSGKAAEAALIYLSQTKPYAQIDLQTELLDNPNLRTKIRIEHALRLAAQTKPERFWVASEEILADAPAPLFSRGLALTARKSRNGAIRIIQLELGKMGYAPGRPSGMLTTKTIRAMNRFCRDNDIWDTCRLGPAKGATIKAIGAAIGEAKGKIS